MPTKSRSRLRVETLIALLGAEGTANLCYFGGGRRVPSYAQYLAWQRRLLIVHDSLHNGYSQRALAAKYGPRTGPEEAPDHVSPPDATRGAARRHRAHVTVNAAWSMTQPSVAEVVARQWPARATFTARLAALEDALQVEFDRGEDQLFTIRVPVTVRLTLDDLAAILPPAEQRLLAHLQARKPLRALDGTPGCRTRSRRNERLQLLLSRVQAYCGSGVNSQ